MRRFLAVFGLAVVLYAAGPEPVVVDTDSGLFGDDGAALAMLMRSPQRVAVPGVIITPGNVWPGQGAKYTSAILKLLGRPGVRVYTGAAGPLIHTAAMAREAGGRWAAAAYMGAFAEEAPGAAAASRNGGAVEFLIREIERQPGGVTILAIAPMTNLALALRLRPDLETRIKRVVFMGGALATPGNATPAAEFNFWFDPEAARIVLRSRIPEKVMFALDICNTAPIRKAEFDRVAAAGTPLTDLFREDLGNRFPGFLKDPAAVGYLWDSLAAAYVLDPGFVTRSETRYLDVQTDWGREYGAVIPLDRTLAPDATPVRVMQTLDFARVFELYRGLLTAR